MDVSELAVEVPTVSPQDSVAKAVGRMKAAGSAHAIVLRNGKYAGIVTVDALARHAFTDAGKAAVGKYATKAAVEKGLDLDAAVHALLVENQEAIPVRANGAVKLVTKLQLLSAVQGSERLRSLRAKDVMAFPYCVHAEESIASALAMLRDLNVSRLPVVDDKDKVLGAVDCLDLLTSAPVERQGFGGDRMRPDISVQSVAHRPVVVKPETTMPKVIEAMRSQGRQYALVVDKGRIAGILTPKRILKLLGEKRAGAYVNVSGLQGEDAYVRELVDAAIQRHLKRVSNKVPVDNLVVHVRTYAHGGKRKEYEAKARLITEKGFFFAEGTAWDLTQAMEKALEKIEKEVFKRTGRAVTLRKRA